MIVAGVRGRVSPAGEQISSLRVNKLLRLKGEAAEEQTSKWPRLIHRVTLHDKFMQSLSWRSDLKAAAAGSVPGWDGVTWSHQRRPDVSVL